MDFLKVSIPSRPFRPRLGKFSNTLVFGFLNKIELEFNSNQLILEKLQEKDNASELFDAAFGTEENGAEVFQIDDKLLEPEKNQIQVLDSGSNFELKILIEGKTGNFN